MKKFMKACAIIALILLIVGFGMAIAAGTIGGTTNISKVVESVTNGKMHINLGTEDGWGIFIGEDEWDGPEALYDIDDNMIFDNSYDVVKGDVEKYAVGSDIKKLDIEAGGCAFYFEQSDDANFYIEAKETGKFQCFAKNNTLYVKSTRTVKNWDNHDDSEIILYIPENYRFEHVDVELGAGMLEMEAIAANEMKLEVGAGQITVDYLQTDLCDIEVGMGEIVIDDMQVNNVNAEVGVGHLMMDGVIHGNVDAKCSMGSIELLLSGSKEEFNYTLEAAMGNVSIDGENYSGVARDKTVKNSADKNMTIECAMGNIEVNFEG